MTYEEFFSEFKKEVMKADVSDIPEHLAFQFNITGEAEGAFYVEVKDGTLHVEPYEYYDRDAIFTADIATFKDIAEGGDPVAAFEEERLRVEGDIEKALRFKEIVDSKK